MLAYQYLTQSHTDAAVNILEQVVALQSQATRLSNKLLRQLDPSKDKAAAAASREFSCRGRHDRSRRGNDRRDLDRQADG